MKATLILVSPLLFCFLLIVCFTRQAAAQTSKTEESSRIKNFGWSLKENPKPPEEKIDGAKAAQTAIDLDDDVIRIETNLVITDVLVLDKQGHSIKGLKKEDFAVFEDSQPQEIEFFSLGDGNIPRSIVLIIDYSGSQLPFIETSIEAAKVLVDKLSPNDRMAIVSDDVELISDFSKDKLELKSKLESLKKQALAGRVGKSEQFSALFAVMNEIFADHDVRPIVIFQTDGDELVRLRGGKVDLRNQKSPQPGAANLIKRYSLAEILTAAEKARSSIYTIYPGLKFGDLTDTEQILQARVDFKRRTELSIQRGVISPNNRYTNFDEKFYRSYAQDIVEKQTILSGLAKYTGGWSDYLETTNQAGEIYTRILSNINNRYVIGYSPVNKAKDGKRRMVKIEIKGHPEYAVWGRKTYYAPDSNEKK